MRRLIFLGVFTKIIHTTVKSSRQAERLASRLLQEGLAKCISFWKIRSIYKWKGKKADESEYVLEIKCADSSAGLAVAALEKLHPYETPMILVIGASANKKYEEWLQA